jgi:predicted component of type VI protein secretion system
MGRLMGERNYQMKVISAAKFEAIHEAQRRLMDHWSEQHRLLPVEMYQELSRLSNKLASAYLQSTSPTAELSYLMENERPAIQDYLRAMKRARDNEAASQELANRRYNLERNNERETLEGRMFDLQESLAQYLIACTARIEPLPDKEAMNEFLDSLTADA